MEQLSDSGIHKTGIKGDSYVRTRGGYIYRERRGRESFIPDSLIFSRNSGKQYIHIGREIKNGITEDKVKSVESGEIRTIMDLEKFKRG